MDFSDRMHEAVTVLFYSDLEAMNRHPETKHFGRLDAAVRWVMEEATMEQRAYASIHFDSDHMAVSNSRLRELYAANRPADGAGAA